MKKLIYLSILFFMYNSCCKEKCQDSSNPECSNYDPCFKYPKRAADFKIYDNPGSAPWYWQYFEYDTFYATSMLFVADYPEESGVEYTWKIGSETLNGKSVTRDNFPENATIPITLIVNHPAKSCYGSKTSDTFTKYFYSVGKNSSGKIINNRMGKFFDHYQINYGGNVIDGLAYILEYRGAYVNNPKYKDTFTIKYQILDTRTVRLDSMFNLPYPGCIQLQNNASGTYNYFWYGSGYADNSNCIIKEKNKTNYLFKLDRYKNIVEMSWKNEAGDSLIWIGKKIN